MTRQQFYKSKDWLNFRSLIIAERTDADGFVHCSQCGKPILHKYDLIIHHKQELSEANVNDHSISLNPDNVEVVCFRCHNKVHERFGYNTTSHQRPVQKQVFIVYGSPCAGKSTWVHEQATEADLIVDMDSIWQMISINDRYQKPAALRSVVFEVRDKLYDIIKYRSGKWHNAYIITGGAMKGDTDKPTALGYAYEDMKAFQDIGVPILYAQGNHDNNIYSNNVNADKFDIYNVFQTFFTKTKGIAYNFAENGTDYYIDFPVGIRVIVLNSCNVKNANNYAYGSGTASWLSSALDQNKTNLLMSHLPSIASQVWNNNHGANADAVKNALTTFVNNGGTLVQVTGHSHVDIAFIKPWLSVMNVCQKFEVENISTTEFGKITGYIDQIVAPSRTARTYTEDAWTACVLKPNSMEFDCIRFGGGHDRYFHYNAIAPTTLTSRLEGVTWSSSDTSVATVSNGVVTGVASGTCGILAKDSEGNYEAWTIKVS